MKHCNSCQIDSKILLNARRLLMTLGPNHGYSVYVLFPLKGCKSMYRNARSSLLDGLITISPLMLGGAIYICFRPLNLLMFDWATGFGLQDTITHIRSSTQVYQSLISDFILFSLPTMLWTFSFTYAVSVIWRGGDNKNARVFFLCMVLLVSIFGEVAQSINLIQGTYDLLDLIANVTGFFLAVCLNTFREIPYVRS